MAAGCQCVSRLTGSLVVGGLVVPFWGGLGGDSLASTPSRWRASSRRWTLSSVCKLGRSRHRCRRCCTSPRIPRLRLLLPPQRVRRRVPRVPLVPTAATWTWTSQRRSQPSLPSPATGRAWGARCAMPRRPRRVALAALLAVAGRARSARSPTPARQRRARCVGVPTRRAPPARQRLVQLVRGREGLCFGFYVMCLAPTWSWRCVVGVSPGRYAPRL